MPNEGEPTGIIYSEQDSICQKGIEEYKKSNFGIAIQYLEKCPLKDGDIECQKILAKCYQKTRRYELSIAYYKKVIKLEPKNYLARLELALLYLRKDKYALAEEQIEYIKNSEADDDIKEQANRMQIVIDSQKQ